MIEPPESLVADRWQTALTRRFLLPALPALKATFLEMRAELDELLADGEALYGKPYPYGYCREIAESVLGRLATIANGPPRSRGERALKTFLSQGGVATVAWGVLRDRYFQNAIQLGALYVDVANDTVDVSKPKVEILPMAESGLEAVQDAAHFARIAESYWGATVYANTALPSLAPLFPIVVVSPDGRAQIQSRTNYMMRLFASDGFQRAEAWLREGPPAEANVVDAIRAACPDDLLAASPAAGRVASVEACRRLRDEPWRVDETWALRMRADLDRIPAVRISTPSSAVRSGISQLWRSNTRVRPGASY